MTGTQTPTDESAATRRRFIAGLGGSVLVAGGAASGATALTDTGDDETKRKDDRKRKDGRAETARDGRHQALSWDADMDMEFDSRMGLAGDPTDGDRDHAVHVTSSGGETSDASAAAVDVRGQSLTLGNVAGSGRLAYDYSRGPDQTAPTPGQIALLLRGGRRDDRFHVAVRGSDAGADTGGWQTRDVSRELTGDGWRVVGVDADRVREEVGMAATTTQQFIERAREHLETEPISNLVGHLGGNAELLGVSIGSARIANPTVVDVFFDEIRVADESYAVPAQLTATPTFERTEGTLAARLSLSTPAHGVNLEDVAEDSVRLSGYAPIARPVPGTDEARAAAEATAVTVEDDHLFVQFDEADVPSTVDELGTAMVYGSFDVPRAVTFLATGEV